MKRWLFICSLLALVLSSPVIQADELWEGNAAEIRRGEFESEGLFAASNSFPQNTKIEVKNLRTGKKANVTVVKRIEGKSPFFLLLSQEAAETLEIGDVDRVRVQISRDFGTDVYSESDELTYSTDPDINPRVALPDITEGELASGDQRPALEEHPNADQTAAAAAMSEKELAEKVASRSPQKKLFREPTESIVSISPDTISPSGPIQGEPLQEELAINEPAVESERAGGDTPIVEDVYRAQSTPSPPYSGVLEEPAVREGIRAEGPDAAWNPPRPEGKELVFTPEDPEPPKSEKMAAAATEPFATQEPPLADREMAYVFNPADPRPPVEEKEEVELTLAELETPEAGERELIFDPGDPALPEERVEVTSDREVAESTTQTEKVENEGRVALSPTEHRPPPVAPASIGTEDIMAGRKYFIQLGAYSDATLAKSLEATYSADYPIEILSVKSGNKELYRVMVGPLNKDESGTVLYWFRVRGFKDAFVRSAN